MIFAGRAQIKTAERRVTRTEAWVSELVAHRHGVGVRLKSRRTVGLVVLRKEGSWV